MNDCPCGSGAACSDCCRPIIEGERPAETAEQLMRSRYSAYVYQEIAYLKSSLHPDQRGDFDGRSTSAWAERATWRGLKILSTEAGGPEDAAGTVEFVASYTEGVANENHHETSRFEKVDGRWYYVDGVVHGPRTVVRRQPKVGRNAPCPCGSGKKFKKCCG